MAFKPNYNLQRADRNRLKQAKKNAKLREKGKMHGSTKSWRRECRGRPR